MCVYQIYNLEFRLSPYKKRSDGCAKSTPIEQHSCEDLIKVIISEESSKAC